MKRVNYFFTLTLALFVGIAFSSCSSGGDDGPTAQETMSKQIAAAWSTVETNSVTVEGTDMTSYFSDVSITLGAYNKDTETGSFAVSGEDRKVFDGVTGWTFSSSDPANANKITLKGATYINSDVTLEVTSEGAGLKLTFGTNENLPPIVESPSTARTASISGKYVVTLKK
ncbi:hypothetical protein FUAX_14050 [Fulvitalea axinellae]|uniref:Lipocalin-like domain-containing protein n=1 Tax=Fulvitalea axinellae TaxID=1182444 RepID=A0AAU9CLP9_9BACT|nr:hypothetical protein FUAX_14050 [Fulvitalea axinellae]